MSKFHIQTLAEYQEYYDQSIRNPETFWDGIAKDNFVWEKHWDTVFSQDFQKAEFKWFEGAKLNITTNCIDRHLESRANQTAIIFEPNDVNEDAQHISYQELHKNVCKMSNILKNMGVGKGDRVCLYLPMIPELAYAVLACARIGAIHSVVFAGFSSSALASRINDSECKLLITADGGHRGKKITELKNIVNLALENTPTIDNVLVVKRTHTEVEMQKGRDQWLHQYWDEAESHCPPEIMNAEDPLFILYTSGSTGKPKGMLHTTAGYMVYTAYSFKNVFNYKDGDIYWCTADIGWITGHSYILYGPLACGATTLMFEGVPSYPDYGRFWEIVEKHKVSQFYTAPTAIRALAKHDLIFVENKKMDSLKVLGTVGEPINEEAWKWYDEYVGKGECPIVDTWWQTETGGIMISSLAGVTSCEPTYATLPLPGIQPVLKESVGKEITEPNTEGALCIDHAWPSMARTIWGDHERYKKTYFSAFPGSYFSGDGAYRNEKGYFRIIGRIDDVIIVSGHNLGTAPIEDAIGEHPDVAESAIVGIPDDVKGNALYGFITLKYMDLGVDRDKLCEEINKTIAEKIGPIAKLDKMQFVMGLPKTRSGKIMRRILRKIAKGETENLGDISTLLNPEVVQDIISEKAKNS